MEEGGCGDVPGAFPSSLPPSPPLSVFALVEAWASTGGHGMHSSSAGAVVLGQCCLVGCSPL